MKSLEKIHVAVLYGGQSTEHEVSLQTAKNIIENLDKNLFHITPIGINKNGSWVFGEKVFLDSLPQKQVLDTKDLICFSPNWMVDLKTHHLSSSFQNSLSQIQPVDVFFPAVHGTFCEDGCLQGLLELAHVPYVGCGVLASSICMDKDIAKRLVAQMGFNVGNYITLNFADWQKSQKICIEKITNNLNFPLFVKPANTGSSTGISKVHDIDKLSSAIDFALRFDKKIVIENGLNVLELEIAILEPLDKDDELIVSEVGEVKSNHEFYSYEAKYIDEHGADLLIPASVSLEIRQEAKKMAEKIFKCLECEGMARIDLFYDLDKKQLVFNEINTIPGFTKISMYPRLLNVSGITYPNLLTHLVFLAMEKNKVKKSIIKNLEHI